MEVGSIIVTLPYSDKIKFHSVCIKQRVSMAAVIREMIHKYMQDHSAGSGRKAKELPQKNNADKHLQNEELYERL